MMNSFQTWDGVRPFLASLHTFSSTWVAVTFSHDGGVLLYGNEDFEIPFPPECMRPIFKKDVIYSQLQFVT